MPFARPTLTQLRRLALQDLASANLPGVDGFLQNAILAVLSWAIAGMAYLHYGYQDWIARQAVPWSATDEWAAGWGSLKGVQRKPATAAVLAASFPGGQPSVPVPAGSAANLLNGQGYTTTADATVNSAGVALVTITANVPGAGGNALVGTQVTLVNGLAGVGATGAITGIVTTGSDIETPDAFKSRYLQVYANPPAGGDREDYVAWAEAVPGVTRAWCSPIGFGPGTVVVYVMFDQAEAAFGGFPQGSNGVATLELRDIPATGDQLVVANALYPLRPVTALVYVEAPVNLPIAFTIADLVPNTVAILAAIQAALAGMFMTDGSPLGMTVYPSAWNSAIDSVPGITQYDLTAPAAPVVVPLGSLPTVGAVTSV